MTHEAIGGGCWSCKDAKYPFQGGRDAIEGQSPWVSQGLVFFNLLQTLVEQVIEMMFSNRVGVPRGGMTIIIDCEYL